MAARWRSSGVNEGGLDFWGIGLRISLAEECVDRIHSAFACTGGGAPVKSHPSSEMAMAVAAMAAAMKIALAANEAEIQPAF